MTADFSEKRHTVRLVPLLRINHLGDRLFDYLVPPALEGAVEVGSIVRAPFGPRTVRGVVLEVRGAGEVATAEDGVDPESLREISEVCEVSVSSELLDLARRLADRYLAPFESCLRLMVPPDTRRKGAGAQRSRVSWVRRVLDGAVPPDNGRRPPTVKQQALLDVIPAEGGPAAAVCAAAGVGRSVLKAVITKGLVEVFDPLADVVAAAESSGLAAAASAGPPSGGLGGGSEIPPDLNPEQQAALDDLLERYAAGGFESRLLWGVTGSGKTEIYLRLIERVLSDGHGAILLVPEIALTPQMVERVTARFGERAGVLHSGLSPKQRMDEYRRFAAGEASVVVGARSAVFAPLEDVRLIIIDEAHDTSYKQEEEPRYHTRVAARMRLEPHGGLFLEGTATPAVESMVDPRAALRLTQRALGREPAVEVVDMRTQGGGSLLAPRSREALSETLRKEEQAIVLLNRRGYAGHVFCESCGHVMTCTDCEVTLTYHSRARRLLCHQCGRAFFQPRRCPACGGPPLTRGAPGTERLHEELRELVPRDQVFRLDSDVVTRAAKAVEILGRFAQARPAVLVGTQMVAKGHDFPHVTLVLVADADTGLYVPDFRAAERTFQLLTQVAGRAGRADAPGRVLVQTWNPDVPCIRMALQRDEQGFYEEELRLREGLGYPPFRDIVRLVAMAEKADRAAAGARFLVEKLRPFFKADELLGPARLPTLRGRERWHLLLASADGGRMRTVVGEAMAQLRDPYQKRGVRLLVDVDPLSFG